jgi:hypothetical protein
MRESFGRDARLWLAEFENITATEAGMELPDAALKIGAPGKGKHFQKDFFYRLVRSKKNYLDIRFIFGAIYGLEVK